MPVSEEVMAEGFLQIVSEARLSVKQFCKTLVGEIEETDTTLTENLNSLLRPYKLSLNPKYSKAVSYHLEAILNLSLYQDFENCVFQKNGSAKLLDPQQDRQAQFSSFVVLRNLSWNEVLRKGTKYYSEEFSKFCDQKMSLIISTLNWTKPWPEHLLQAFFVAAKCIWLLHLLAFSFNPPLGILRVEDNTSFDPHYMEDMLMERQKSHGANRVKIMVMPGFYVQGRVLKCFGDYFSGTIILALTMSVASYLLIPFLFRDRSKNWENAPPGPVGWPILGSLPHLSNCHHEDFFHWAKIYGPLISLNLGLKPAIVVSSPEMAAHILKEKEGKFSSRTITETIRVISYDAHSIIFSPYGNRWKALRRIMVTELLSPKAFEQFEPLRTTQVHGLLKYLYVISKSNTQVNIAEYAFTALANLVSNFVCSKNLFDNSKPEGKLMKERFWELIKLVGTPNFSDLIPILKPLDPQGLKRRANRVFGKLDAFYDKLIAERNAEKKQAQLHNTPYKKMDMLEVLLSYERRRSCAGWPLAHRMVHYYLAALLHAFEWESPPEILNDVGERVGLTIQKGKSLLSTPKPRLPASVYEG
ncbi:hypothetical protein V6N13_119166 [Hibiscus sabdariffa]